MSTTALLNRGHSHGVALVLAMLLVCALPSRSVAQTGGISGTVTNAGTLAGLPSVGLWVYNAGGGYVTGATTGAGGSFVVSGLPAGTYYVRTNAGALNYVDELYNNITCVGVCSVTSGTPISVTAGATTSDINFALVLGGAISGTVSDAGTAAGLSSVTIWLYYSNGNPARNVVTGAGGTYTFAGVPAGTYYARTYVVQGSTYGDELYNDIYCVPGCTVTSGTPIAVSAGVTTGGINFALSPGGAISGTVTDATGLTGLAYVTVDIYSSEGSLLKSPVTDGSGVFSVGGLPTGTYYARTWGASSLNYIDELYNDMACSAGCTVTGGTPIAVIAGATTSGINFALSVGGSITGTLTDAVTLAALQGIEVEIYSSTGSYVRYATTSSNGAFSVGGLATGTYFARTWIPSNLNYLNELYNDIPCVPFNCTVTSGTPISVTAGATTGGVNFALSPGGAISGTVTNAVSLAGLANVEVEIYSSTGSYLKYALTNGSGVFSVGGLPTGTYYARTWVSGTQNYVNEIYNDVACPGSCTVTRGAPISVTAGATTGGIDFALWPGGSITGTITDAVSHAGLADVEVGVYDQTATFVKYSATNGSGAFSIYGLPTGTYYVRTWVPFDLNYVDEVYNDIPCSGSCMVTNGTAVPVTLGAATTGINFALSPGGSISGTVTDAVSHVGLADVAVRVDSSSGTALQYAYTDDGGAFSVIGLPTGTYYARTEVPYNLNYADELYSDIPCPGTCIMTTGTPIAVTLGTTTSGINFALSPGGVVTGTVVDAVSLAGLANVMVGIYSSTDTLLNYAITDTGGPFSVVGLPTGTYYARTFASGAYVDELYNDIPCAGCDVALGVAIAVTAGATTSGINFALTPGGGAISGTVTEAGSNAAIRWMPVSVHNAAGVLVKSASTNEAGLFTVTGLPAGTYYARTQATASELYVNRLFDSLPCFSDCVVTDGAPIVVTMGVTTTGVDFALPKNLVHNGAFDGTTEYWLRWATPDMGYIVAAVAEGVFEYYRVPPPPGTTNQAVVFQETGTAYAAQTPLVAAFDLGNSSSVRKRISVLVLDSNFSDLSVCTFWIPPNAPLTSYQMKTHTAKAWTDAAIYFYAASAGSDGGAYRLDNVVLYSDPTGSTQQTTCIDPTAPTPPGGAAGPNLLTNGDFTTGQLTPWGLYGQITSQIAGGVFEFYRPAGTPAGVVLQNTNLAMTANEILTANFQLGNSSPVRKRVTVLVHDNDFLDLSACTFYLDPGQPLSNYALRTFATKAWTNATVSVYPATVGTDQWIRLDNVTLQRTPSATITGTECAEPGAAPLLLTQAPPVPVSRGADVAADLQVRTHSHADASPGFAVDTGDAWRALDPRTWEAVALADETSALPWVETIDLRGASRATLTFLSQLTTRGSWAEVEVRTTGGVWLPVRTVLVSGDETIAIDLSPFAGTVVEVQWIFHGVAAPDGAEPDTWQVSEVNVEMAAP